MRINENVYVGDDIKNLNKYLHKLENGKIIKNFYIVVFSLSKDTLEVYPAYVFLQKYYRQLDFELVAISKDKDVIYEYIRRVTDLSMRIYGEFKPYDIINNLNEQDKQYLINIEEKDS